MKRIGFARFHVLLTAAYLGCCCGCAARRAVPDQNYRLTKVDATSFLLPPDFYPKRNGSLETKVPLGNLKEGGGSGSNAKCSIHDRWFALARGRSGSGWVAHVPAPPAWNDLSFVSRSQGDWNRFLAQMNALEAEGCITPKAYERATNWLEESFPAPATLVSLFRDPLGRQGISSLKPGMRLFVERSIFRPKSAETVANYLGETKVYYRVVRRSNSEIGLKLAGVRRSKGLSSKALKRFPDATLAPTFKAMGALRLFYLTLYVPPALQRNGLLVGARDPKEMIEIVGKVVRDPQIPCADIATTDVACAAFTGMVSASLEVNIRVNGKKEYVAAYSTVDSLLRPLPPNEWAEAWKTLRIWRLFRGKPYPLEFNRDDPAAHLLVLFAGDRITWTADSYSGK